MSNCDDADAPERPFGWNLPQSNRGFSILFTYMISTFNNKIHPYEYLIGYSDIDPIQTLGS